MLVYLLFSLPAIWHCFVYYKEYIHIDFLFYDNCTFCAFQDPRFNKEVDKKTGYRTHSILCEPILNYDGEVTGVAQIINKVTGSHDFTKQDEEVCFISCF